VGPHGGQYGVPEVNYLCPDEDCPWLAEIFDLLYEGKYRDEFIQSTFSFATYWKDPFNLEDYLYYSQFLADINNERDQKNQTYKKNMLSLNSFLLVASPDYDEIVVPRTSPWFDFFFPNSESKVQNFNDTDMYKGDFFGLKSLFESNRLLIRSANCSHMDFPDNSCKIWYDLYTKPLLNN